MTGLDFQTDCVKGEIFDCVREHSDCCKLDGRWSCLTPDTDALRLSDARTLVNELRRQFPIEALLDSGLAYLAGGIACLRKELSDCSTIIMLQSPGGWPYGLMTETTCLGSEPVAALACLADEFTQRAAKNTDGKLLLACSVEDAVLLRALGFAAVTWAHLHDMHPATAERFFSAFDRSINSEGGLGDAEDGNDSEPTEGEPIADRSDTAVPRIAAGPATTDVVGPHPINDLIFAGWSISDLSAEMPADLPAVATFLYKLADYLDLDPINPTVWRPSQADIERFEFLLHHRDSERLRTAFLDSLNGSSRCLETLVATPAVVPSPPASELFLELRRLAGSEGEWSGSFRRKQLWEKLLSQVDEAIIAPLIEDAMQSADARERNAKLAAAQLSRLFHIATAAVSENLSRAIGHSAESSIDAKSLAQIKDVLTLADRLLKLNEEIDRCQPALKVKVLEASPSPAGQLALPRST